MNSMSHGKCNLGEIECTEKRRDGFLIFYVRNMYVAYAVGLFDSGSKICNH